MTRELLQEANNLSHAIIEIEQQVRRVEEMRQSDQSLLIGTATAGSIAIGDTELITDITGMVIARLNQVKEDMYNRLLAL